MLVALKQTNPTETNQRYDIQKQMFNSRERNNGRSVS